MTDQRVWVVTDSAQVAHLLPSDWRARAGEIRAACGGRVRARAILRAHKQGATSITAHCYRCERALEREKGATDGVR